MRNKRERCDRMNKWTDERPRTDSRQICAPSWSCTRAMGWSVWLALNSLGKSMSETSSYPLMTTIKLPKLDTRFHRITTESRHFTHSYSKGHSSQYEWYLRFLLRMKELPLVYDSRSKEIVYSIYPRLRFDNSYWILLESRDYFEFEKRQVMLYKKPKKRAESLFLLIL